MVKNEYDMLKSTVRAVDGEHRPRLLRVDVILVKQSHTNKVLCAVIEYPVIGFDGFTNRHI